MTGEPGARRRPDVEGVELVGGTEPLSFTLHEYDEGWVRSFDEHRDRILVALGAQDAAGDPDAEGDRVAVVDPDAVVEHIGSTSVPGLAAKPIVDILVVVDDITAEEDYLDPLLAAGYLLRTREPGHRLVRTPQRDVHVHILERGDPAADEYLLLRDHLRRSPEDRELYESTKRDLIAHSWDDSNSYADAKTAVIAEIKARARAAAD